MPPLVHLLVDLQRLFALRPLGYADRRPALVHLVDDPIAVEGLVGQQGIKGQPFDKRRDADRVVAIARQQDEPHKVAERVREGQYFGRPAAFRLTYSLTESPPFAPCPAR